MKAMEFTRDTDIVSAFVSTSSICQGQQVEPLWAELVKGGICIDFAHTVFKWESEAESGAYVFVVIVGFSRVQKSTCYLYSGDRKRAVSKIRPYLIEGESILVGTGNKPICDVPIIGIGNQPISPLTFPF